MIDQQKEDSILLYQASIVAKLARQLAETENISLEAAIHAISVVNLHKLIRKVEFIEEEVTAIREYKR